MGLILAASCGRCGFARTELRLGATMSQMSGERRSAWHLYACSCGDVAQVELALGEPPGEVRCDRCRAPLALGRDRAFRITSLKGERLSGHACPRCREPELTFREEGRFL